VEAARLGVAVETLEDPEFIAALARFVAELKDPQAIPVLSKAIYGWLPVMRALADFGQQAAPAVLDVVTSSGADKDEVNHGLITLRFMVEGAKTRPLSAGTIEQIRRAAEQRLSGKQYFTTLWYATDLAAVLNDPGLRRTVESLASDRKEVISRGVDDPQLIEETQRRATDGLRGVAPLPRP
jgi:hypothetical protein